ncbi:MAG: YraN family protein [Patescibacteria group bacterium]|nr:YraN family protein [Patescibacteria group bacterium]
MKYFNKIIGKLAEDIAMAELQRKGYQILTRNFAHRYGEIDIIAKDKETTVFVEVKAKTGLDAGLPEEMVSKRKLEKIRSLALLYTEGKEIPCRIDVIAIVLTKERHIQRITHYQNVY